MIQTIAPLQYFPISRVLPDPSDITVYYVMAEVRNGNTGVLLSSVKLLSQGGQIYTGSYRAPALASSQGLFLTITTRVYTDNAYSVPSQIYGNDQDTFQVFDQANNAIIMAQQIAATVAGSIPDNSPADVNYKKIEKLVVAALIAALKDPSESLAKLHARIETLDTKTDLGPALEAIAGSKMDAEALTAAIAEAVHGRVKELMEPLHQSLAEMRQALPDEAPSLEPVLAALDALKAPPELYTAIKEMHGNTQNVLAIATKLAQEGVVVDGTESENRIQMLRERLAVLRRELELTLENSQTLN